MYICTASNQKQVYSILNNWCMCIEISCGQVPRYRQGDVPHAGLLPPAHGDNIYMCMYTYIYICIICINHNIHNTPTTNKDDNSDMINILCIYIYIYRCST